MGVAVMRKNKWMDVIVQLKRCRKNQRMNSKLIITFCQLLFTGLVSFWHGIFQMILSSQLQLDFFSNSVVNPGIFI
jgi:hypothetical protein